MPPTLAVIIVSWNVCDMLRECLLSLQKAQPDLAIKLDIYVVDSASADKSAGMVRSEFPDIHLLAQSENIGYVRGNNLVLESFLDGKMPDYVWLLNADTLVTAEAINTLIDFLAAHPHAGLIGPKLMNSDLSLQECAFRFPGILQPLFDFGYLPQRLYYSALNGRYAPRKYAGHKPFRIDHPLGAAMLARGKTVQQIGLLDTRFFMYCEEIDWAWRMKKANWEVWLVPDATVIHHGGASSKQARAKATAYLWESRARFYRKHRSRWIYGIVQCLVKRYFSSQTPDSQEWAVTNTRILTAWSHPYEYRGTEQ